jgi:methanethiol S-methyltransferase
MDTAVRKRHAPSPRADVQFTNHCPSSSSTLRIRSSLLSQPQASHLAVAWLGAAVFAASLLWFVYCYLVTYGVVSTEARVSSAVVTNVILFSIFALHHSLFARSGVKRAVQAVVPPALERSLYTWIASLLFIAVCTWWRPVTGVAYELHGVWRFLAYVAQTVGFVLSGRAAGALDTLDLAGIRPVIRAASGTNRTAHAPLKTDGLFRVVRHPLYFGWALFVFATPLMTGTRLVFAVVSTGYLALAIPWEERSLVDTFGTEYESYRKRVRWRMLPWLY